MLYSTYMWVSFSLLCIFFATLMYSRRRRYQDSLRNQPAPTAERLFNNPNTVYIVPANQPVKYNKMPDDLPPKYEELFTQPSHIAPQPPSGVQNMQRH